MTAKTALVVDDSKSARFALRRFLESHRYKVETAEGAEDCFRVLENYRPDVIFLDHVMPGIDGFAALRQIKADPATAALRVVICSSNEGEDFEAQARSCGAAGVLQKPPSAEQLGRILDNLQNVPSPAAAPIVAATPPVPAPSKVSNIREPDVAIEQRVMNVLRSSLANPAAAAPPAASAPAAATALNEVAQSLSLQIAQLQSQAAQLQTRIHEEQTQAADAMAMALPDFSGINAELATQLQRIEALEQLVDEHFHELSNAIEAGLRSQIERIEHVTTVACEAAREEAQRAVMSAGARISDQLANSILTALRGVSLNPSAPRTPEAASPTGTEDRRQA